jgi:hypothetical protein
VLVRGMLAITITLSSDGERPGTACTRP